MASDTPMRFVVGEPEPTIVMIAQDALDRLTADRDAAIARAERAEAAWRALLAERRASIALWECEEGFCPENQDMDALDETLCNASQAVEPWMQAGPDGAGEDAE